MPNATNTRGARGARANVAAKRYAETEFINGNGEVISSGEDLASTGRRIGSRVFIKAGECQQVVGQFNFMGWPRYSEEGQPLSRNDGSPLYLSLASVLRGEQVTIDSDYADMGMNLDLSADLVDLAALIEGGEEIENGALVELTVIGRDSEGYNNSLRYHYGR